MKAGRLLLLFLAALVSISIFLNAWQGCRYARLTQEIKRLEEEQKDWIERNKKLLASLALFSAPERIEQIAGQTLKLQRIDSGEILQVRLIQEGESGLE